MSLPFAGAQGIRKYIEVVLIDPSTGLGYVASGGSGGGGGGAITAATNSFAVGAIRDGADTTQGTMADAAYGGSGNATVISALKGLYAKIPALGAAATANSLPVTLPSDLGNLNVVFPTAQAVTNTSLDNSYVSSASAIRTYPRSLQATGSNPDVVQISDGSHTATVDAGTSYLNTYVKQMAALPSGSNTIGAAYIIDGANSTTNQVGVDASHNLQTTRPDTTITGTAASGQSITLALGAGQTSFTITLDASGVGALMSAGTAALFEGSTDGVASSGWELIPMTLLPHVSSEGNNTTTPPSITVPVVQNYALGSNNSGGGTTATGWQVWSGACGGFKAVRVRFPSANWNTGDTFEVKINASVGGTAAYGTSGVSSGGGSGGTVTQGTAAAINAPWPVELSNGTVAVGTSSNALYATIPYLQSTRIVGTPTADSLDSYIAAYAPPATKSGNLTAAYGGNINSPVSGGHVDLTLSDDRGSSVVGIFCTSGTSTFQVAVSLDGTNFAIVPISRFDQSGGTSSLQAQTIGTSLQLYSLKCAGAVIIRVVCVAYTASDSISVYIAAGNSSNDVQVNGGQIVAMGSDATMATIKAASTAPASGDTSLVVAISPNNLTTDGSVVPSPGRLPTLPGVVENAPSGLTTSRARSLSLDTSGNLRVINGTIYTGMNSSVTNSAIVNAQVGWYDDRSGVTTQHPVSFSFPMPVNPRALSYANQNDIVGTVVTPVTAASLTNIAQNTSTVQLLAANTSRRTAYIMNDTPGNLYIAYAASSALTAYSVKIPSEGFWEMPSVTYNGQISGIWDVSGSGKAYITEL